MSKNARQMQALPLSVSQNFLTNTKTIQRLLRLTSIDKGDHVIEIGCGKGHITGELARRCGQVTAYELDKKLHSLAQARLADFRNIRLKNEDFLQASLPGKGEYKVFSNIPFSITSAIVRKLTQTKNPPSELWLIMEKGAAKRFMGTPRDGLSSILIKPFFDAKIKYHFARQDFHPSPSVEVVLLHLQRRKQPDIAPAQRSDFARFVKTGLEQGIGRLLTKRQIGAALKAAGLEAIGPSATLLYVQWLCLFRCHQRLHRK